MATKARRRTRGKGRAGRAEIHGDIEAVVAAPDVPRTVAEIATVTRLHLRTVYRILRELPRLGMDLEQTRGPADGPGRPPVRFRIVRASAANGSTARTKRTARSAAAAAVRRELVRAEEAALELAAEVEALETEIARARDRSVKKHLAAVHAALAPPARALEDSLAVARERFTFYVQR